MNDGFLQQVDTPPAALRRPGQHVRRRFHRHARDELRDRRLRENGDVKLGDGDAGGHRGRTAKVVRAAERQGSWSGFGRRTFSSRTAAPRTAPCGSRHGSTSSSTSATRSCSTRTPTGTEIVAIVPSERPVQSGEQRRVRDSARGSSIFSTPKPRRPWPDKLRDRYSAHGIEEQGSSRSRGSRPESGGRQASRLNEEEDRVKRRSWLVCWPSGSWPAQRISRNRRRTQPGEADAKTAGRRGALALGR